MAAKMIPVIIDGGRRTVYVIFNHVYIDTSIEVFVNA